MQKIRMTVPLFISSFHISKVALVEGGGVLKYHGKTVAVSTFARIRMPAVTSDIIASERDHVFNNKKCQFHDWVYR